MCDFLCCLDGRSRSSNSHVWCAESVAFATLQSTKLWDRNPKTDLDDPFWGASHCWDMGTQVSKLDKWKDWMNMIDLWRCIFLSRICKSLSKQSTSYQVVSHQHTQYLYMESSAPTPILLGPASTTVCANSLVCLPALRTHRLITVGSRVSFHEIPWSKYVKVILVMRWSRWWDSIWDFMTVHKNKGCMINMFNWHSPTMPGRYIL